MSVLEDHIVNRVFIILHYHYITGHSLHNHYFYSLRDMNLKFLNRPRL